MTRLETSWAIAKRSWAVLHAERSLAWFPVLSFLATIAVVAAWAAVVAVSDGSGSGGFHLGAMSYVLGAVAYVAVAFVQTYFLAALVAGADARLDGRETSFRGALDVATARMHRLLPWAVVSATVSVVLNQLERQGLVGRILGSLLGLAWRLLTFLTVPILVLEDVGVGVALRRSKELFVRTWGENVVAQAGLSIVGLLAFIPGVLLVALGVATGNAIGIALFAVLGVAWLLVAATVIAALSGIYRTALYRYAATGMVPSEFAGVELDQAFKPRQGNNSSGFGGPFGRGGLGRGGFGGGFGGFAQ